jgi:hypothetical protein
MRIEPIARRVIYTRNQTRNDETVGDIAENAIGSENRTSETMGATQVIGTAGRRFVTTPASPLKLQRSMTDEPANDQKGLGLVPNVGGCHPNGFDP